MPFYGKLFIAFLFLLFTFFFNRFLCPISSYIIVKLYALFFYILLSLYFWICFYTSRQNVFLSCHCILGFLQPTISYYLPFFSKLNAICIILSYFFSLFLDFLETFIGKMVKKSCFIAFFFQNLRYSFLVHGSKRKAQ